jgi:hypothetical protein
MLGYASEAVNCGTRQSAGQPERSNVINPKMPIPGPRRSDAIGALTTESSRCHFPSPSLSLNQAALSPMPPRLVHEILIHKTIINIFCLGSYQEVWTYRITVQTTRIMLWKE